MSPQNNNHSLANLRAVFVCIIMMSIAPILLTTSAFAVHANTVSISVDSAAQLTQQSDFYKATTNVAVNTSKPYGFDLTMKADGNGDLVNTVDPSHRISNMQNNSGYRGIEGIPANSWGYYMYDWHHNITVRPVYGHVPTAKDGERTLLGVTAAEQRGCSTNHSNCTKDVVFVANIEPAKLASGSYSASITYTATARPKPIPVVEPTICESGNRNNDCQVDLDSNMIPVKYTGNNYYTQWTSVANPEDSHDKGNWYNYNNKQWANAVTVKYPSKYRGQTRAVDQDDILGYWVYIPRYAYEVMRRDGTDKPVPAQNFLISFEKTTTPKRRPAACSENGQDYREDCDLNRDYIKGHPSTNGTWATHPAFTFGSKELNGIWFAKFETTGTSTQPTVLPNETHLSGSYIAAANIGRMYNTAKTFGVADYNNIGGRSDYSEPSQNSHNLNKFSSHMVTNSDWGAATYLSASKYGAGYNSVQINSQNESQSRSYGVTGCGPRASGNTGTYSDGGTLDTQFACSLSDSQRAYNGYIGQLASTTNNITGIYDMSGGSWEYTAASYTTNLGGSATNSYFGSKAYAPYVNIYDFSNFNSCTYGTCGGQALHEVNLYDSGGANQWNSNWSYFTRASGPWFRRGGSAGTGLTAGLFYADGINGGTDTAIAFRVALAPVRY